MHFINKRTRAALALLLLTALTACASGAENTPAPAASTAGTAETAPSAQTSDTASSSTAAASSVSVPEETLPEGADAVNLPDETLLFVPCTNMPRQEQADVPENERASVAMSYDLLEVAKETADGTVSLTALNRKIADLEYARKQARDKQFVARYNDAKEAKSYYTSEAAYPLLLMRADTRVFSFLEEQYESLVSPDETVDTYAVYAHNYDAVTAKEIRLADVVNDTEALALLAADAVREQYDTTNPAYAAADQFDGIDLAETIAALLDDESGAGGLFAWAPCYYGLRLVFARSALTDPDGYARYMQEVTEVNPHVLKKFDVTVPYTAAPELFAVSYTAQPPQCIAHLQAGVSYLIDFGDGPVPFRVNAPRKYEQNAVLYTGEYTVQTGDAERQSFEAIGMETYRNFGVAVYLVRTEENIFLYLDTLTGNDTDRLQVYAFEDGAFRFAGVSDEMLDNDRMPPFDPASFMSEGIFYILPDPYAEDGMGSMRGYHTCSVSPGGMPQGTERAYQVSGEDVRVTAIDLELDTLPDADASVPVKEHYDAGTVLRVFRVEPGSHVDLEADDGRIVRLYINGVDSIDLIDGHELHEAFADPRKATE